MCGFFCAISANDIDLELSTESLNLITHRGPDSQKYFLNKKCTTNHYDYKNRQKKQ